MPKPRYAQVSLEATPYYRKRSINPPLKIHSFCCYRAVFSIIKENSMTSETKRDFWRQHIEGWRQSKLSQKTYCTQQGLSFASFGYWRTAPG